MPAVPAVLAGMLETVVVDLGLARDAIYVPLDRAADASSDGCGALREGWIAIPVPGRGPEAPVEGHLCADLRDDAALEQVQRIADLAGAALGESMALRRSAARAERVRRVAERLQDALLPTLPHLPSTTLAVRYQAASSEARVGGDFYDVFALPDGRVLIVVGDVVGKGIEAATRTSRITMTMRALALTGLGLADLLEELDRQFVFQEPETFVTVWAGIYEPEDGELHFASLGHPPALLLRESGTSLWLETESLPLGMRDLAFMPIEVRTRKLETRDLLVLYTDGVIETSKDVVEGQRALLDAVSTHREDVLETLPDELLDALLTDAGHSDDALLLLLRRR